MGSQPIRPPTKKRGETLLAVVENRGGKPHIICGKGAVKALCPHKSNEGLSILMSFAATSVTKFASI